MIFDVPGTKLSTRLNTAMRVQTINNDLLSPPFEKVTLPFVRVAIYNISEATGALLSQHVTE